MPSVIESAFITIEASAFFTALWGNGFIVLVFSAHWVKIKKISWYDFMFISFGISKIGMLCMIIQDSIELVFYPDTYGNGSIETIITDFLWNLSNSFNTWCATCLGIFYFFKLSSFSHPFFLWLKWRRGRFFLATQLGFLLILIGNILSIKYDHILFSEYLKMERNITWQKWKHQKQFFRKYILLNLGSFVTFSLSLIPFFLLIFSLARHIRRMMHHANGSGDFNTEGPVRARNTIVSFLIFLIIHYVFNFLIIWAYYTVENSICVLTMETLTILYSLVHCFIMIQGSKKLNETFVNLGRKFEFCIKGI